MKREWWYSFILLVAFVALGSYYLSKPRTTGLRLWLWGTALAGSPEHSPRSNSVMGKRSVLDLAQLERGSSPRLGTGRSVVRGKGEGPKESRRARGVLGPPLLGPAAGGDTQPKLSGVRGTDEAVHWGRNPFLTPEEEATGGRPGTKGLEVKTIIVGDDKSVATLGRYTVSVGENIGEEKVVEIRRDAVVLERNGRRRILRAAELHRISVQIAGPEKNNGVTKNNGDREK